MSSLLITFWKLPLALRTVIWVLVVWLFTVPFYLLSADGRKDPGNVFSGLILCGLVGIVGYSIKSSSQKKTQANALAAYSEPTQHLQRTLGTVPYFQVAQWCVLPVPGGARALAVNTDHSQVAVLDYTNPRSISETPQTYIKIYNAQDVLRAELSEDSYQRTHINTTTQTKGKSQASTGSVIGRAIVGGVLLGPTGAVIGGATAKRNQTSTGVTTGTHTSHTIVRSLELRVTVNDPAAPVQRLPFLLGEVDRGDGAYVMARQNADHWQAQFDILSHRRAASQNAAMTQGYPAAQGYPAQPPTDPYTDGRLF